MSVSVPGCSWRKLQEMVCWSDAGPYGFRVSSLGWGPGSSLCGVDGLALALSLYLPSDLLTLAYSLTLPLFDVSFVVITLCYFSFRSVSRAELLSDIVSVFCSACKTDAATRKNHYSPPMAANQKTLRRAESQDFLQDGVLQIDL